MAPQTLLAPSMKEVIVDTASDGVWVNRTPRQLSWTVFEGTTPGNIRNSVSAEHDPWPVLIEINGTFPTCGLGGSLQVGNKRHSSSSGLVWQIQKLDSVIDGKLPDDLDSESIFSKLIGHKISNSFSGDLYLSCRMNFVDDRVQTKAPQFMSLGFSAINELYEISALSTPAARIWRPTDEYYWRAIGHVFGEATAVGMSAAKSEHDYNYKTGFQIWRYNKQF